MEDFDPTKDYKSLHLEWLKNNKSFRPKSGIPLNYSSYFDYMTELYRDTIKSQTTAYWYLKDDHKFSKRSKTINEEIDILFGYKPDVSDYANTFFITFNFDPNRFKPEAAVKAVERLFNKSWVDIGYGVFECYTSAGQHPHFMCKLKVNKYNKKGKLLDKMAESVLAKFTGGKHFIDIKEFQPIHQDYIELDKRPEKQIYLEQDKIWRLENNIPEYLEKK